MIEGEADYFRLAQTYFSQVAYPIIDLLKRSTRPLGEQEIIDHLKPEQADNVGFYLITLEDKGLIEGELQVDVIPTDKTKGKGSRYYTINKKGLADLENFIRSHLE